jgi:hypothetical protein
VSSKSVMEQVLLSWQRVTRVGGVRWEWLEYATDTFTVTEERGGTPYRLRSGCLRLLARRVG